MPRESSYRTPDVSYLRAAATESGVFPEDADLELVLDFLNAILPRLAELEDRLPPGMPPE
jgi:hypothetical protein